MADINEVETRLRPWLNELWLNLRFDMVKIIQELDQKGDLANWVQFLKFLSQECSGSQFSDDKQWSELLNLMQINKLINQKTLKFGHLLKNKSLIELNSSKIRQLNEKSRRLASFNKLISDLESSIKVCCLDLNDISTSDGAEKQEISLSELDHINTTRRYIQDRCQAPLNALENEFRSNVGGQFGSTLDDKTQFGGQKLIQMRDKIKLIETFLSKLMMLQDLIQQLKPLMSSKQTNSKNSTSEPTKSILSNSSLSIDNSLAKCRSEHEEVVLFNKKLFETLRSLCKPTSQKSLQKSKFDLNLNRLFIESKNGKVTLIKPELFISALDNNLVKIQRCKCELEKIFKILRLEFGRLYFVNDIELLQIISLDTDLISMQTKETSKLLCKLYNNSINLFILDSKDKTKIIGVQNPYDERIYFSNYAKEPVLLHKKINIYSLEIIRVLNACMSKLRATLRNQLVQSFLNLSKKDRESEISEAKIEYQLPVQLMLLIEHIRFCKFVESSLNDIDWKNQAIEQSYESRLSRLNKELEIGSEKTLLDQYKISACISQTIQFLSILNELKQANVRSCDDWIWLKQLRYNINVEEESCECLIIDMKFIYNFDYLPFQIESIQNRSSKRNSTRLNFKRLIATELTYRCITSACHAHQYLRLGANLLGPAGSGKTETIKALGHALGHIVIVHNCDESNDSKALDQLIWGLAHTGLWGCFDEFNRLSESTLSRVSSTLELVQTSLRNNLKTVQLSIEEHGYEDKQPQIMSLDQNAAFFITLNPVDKSNRYGGRRRLPANLRSLFQPISMVQVQLTTIVSESLRIASCSSSTSGNLGKNLWIVSEKLVKLFTLMKQESPFVAGDNNNCEWDLRLVVAILKRFQIELNRINYDRSIEFITQTIALATQYEVSTRLNETQLQKFNCHLTDIFGINKEKLDSELADILPNCTNRFSRALYALLQTRTGVLLLGPTNSGKTTSWKMLLASLNQNGERVAYLIINPRACLRSQLFDHREEESTSSSKWLEGLFTHITRVALARLRAEDNLDQFWLILDGPLEPDWVESLNSVLDDNRVLTLASGERLDFSLQLATDNNRSKDVKIIFETDNNKYASPATMSRLGLIYYHENGQQQRKQLVDETSIESQSLLNNQAKILIVIGTDRQVTDYLSKQTDIDESYLIKYCCHPNSRCDELSSLLTNSRGFKTIYLANFDSIKPEDDWQVQSFVELLRFVVGHGIYYNPDIGPWNSEKNKFKLIIQVESIDSLNKRLLSLCDIVTLKTGNEDDAEIKGLDRQQPSELDDMLHSLENCSVTSVICNGHSYLNLLESVSRPYTDSLQATAALKSRISTRMFNNSQQIRLNLIQLEELFGNSEDTSKQSTLASLNSESIIWVLNRLECNLMNEQQRNRLFYLLNCFQRKPKMGRFVYLTYQNPLDKYWTSISAKLELQQYRVDFLSQDISIIGNFLKSKLIKTSLSNEKLSWLAKEMKTFQLNQLLGANVEIELNQMMHLLDNLIYRFENVLNQQRSCLNNGLERLVKFESNVETIRSFCNSSAEELSKKRKEMDSIVKSLDDKLRDSELLKSNLRNMSLDQETKSKALSERQSMIAKQLVKVRPMLEKSKREIEQNLKPEALNEIRTLRAPPKTIKDILDGVLIVLGNQNLSWQVAKSLLAKASLRQEITSLNLERIINKNMMTKLSQLMKDSSKKDSFDRANATRASKAILPLLDWLLAVYEYGRVQVNVEPLTNEMDQLKLEQGEINKKITHCEEEVARLDGIISTDRKKLDQLRLEYNEFERQSNILNGKIERAIAALKDCNEQLKEWRNQAASIEIMESRNVPMRYALFLTIRCLFGEEPEIGFLNDEHNLYQKLVYFMFDEQVSSATKHKIPKQELIMMELMKMYAITEESQLIPFVDLDSKQKTNVDQFEQVSIFESIIRQNRFDNVKTKTITTITCHELSDWKNLLDISVSLNKFIILHLIEPEQINALDILDVVTRYKMQHNDSTNRLNIVLMGKSSIHTNLISLCPFIRFIKIRSLQDELDADEVYSTVSDGLVANFDKDLSDTVSKLKQQFGEKRRDRARLESSLISRLLTQGQAATSDNQLDEPLIAMLSDLQLKTKQLDADVRGLKIQLDSLAEKKKLIYEKIAKHASEYFIKTIIPISIKSTFYHLSLEKYIELLMTKGDKHEINNNDLNFRAVNIHFSRSLSLEDKGLMMNHLKDDLSNGDNLEAALNEMLSFENQDRRSNSRLMIAVNEATKSSPQLYIDYLMINKELKQEVRYIKLFATNNKFDNEALESRLRTLVTEDDSHRSIGKTIAICIVNAHLARKWINSRLLSLINDEKNRGKFIFILVAELDPDFQAPFELKILDEAQCKYWHDEMSLSLVQRFDMYSKALNCNPMKSNVEPRFRYTQQLILFHCVCQERTKLNLREDQRAWRNERYLFDYDQLARASKTVDILISRTSEGLPGRELICNYIAKILYGSRMDNEEDEEKLTKLAYRFFGTSESTGRQIDSIERLRAVSDNTYLTLWNDVIGIE